MKKKVALGQTVDEAVVEKVVSGGSSTDSLNTENQPVPPEKEQASPCNLCLWLEKRINNTVKEQIKHMEKYHVT